MIATISDAPTVETPTRSTRPLRILLVTEAAGAGVGRHFLDLAKGLADQGVDVQGIYSPGRIDEQFASRLATGEYPPMTELAMRRSVGWHDLTAARQLRQWIKSNGPFDLIHAHSSKAGAIVRWAVWRDRTPVVYTPHAFITLDPHLSRLKRLVFGTAERVLSWRGRQRIIAVGNREADHARTLGISPAKVKVVVNGAAPCSGPTRDELRRRWNLPAEAIVVGFVGRFSPQKAPLTLVQIMRELAPQQPRLHLAIVGSGPLEDQLRQGFAEAGVEDRIRWLGSVDGARQMPGFDLLCLTSLYEGMSYVILEAAQAGLPIIATDAGDTAAVVRDGMNGRCVPVKQTGQLIRALDEVLSDDMLRERLATQARQSRGEFSLERMVQETLQVYADLQMDCTKPQR
jgi:glycosyltransferase involved in cell wall biosynthesis